VSRAAATFARAIREALARNPRVHAWQVRSVRRSGFQTYLVQVQTEAERHVESEVHEVVVFVKNGELLGRASVSLGAGDEHHLAPRIDDAVFMAGLGGDAPWSLPKAEAWPHVELFDAALAGNRARSTAHSLVDTWRAAVSERAAVRPSSMELFCGQEATTLENSAGLVAHASATRISLLTLLLASGDHLAERESWEERRRAQDLDVRAITRQVAEEALDLTHAIPPPSGNYPVVIDANEITALLSPIQANASAESLYQKSSRFEPGKPLPIKDDGGEPFTLISNAVAPYGLTSYAFDGNGVAGRRIEIVKDGVLTQPWATKQFADYLKTSPTGGFGNWELPAGKTPLDDLLNSGERVLMVRNFSWLTPEAGRGNFGSEIRLGYLYERGVRTPIKGGTVSGNVFAALGTARYAKETVFRGDYIGPAAVRFEGLTVAGK